MSKRNMLLGLAAGKIGDLVFYRDGGEQRTRTRVVPKNPRSQAQMAQRVRIANVSATYRLLKSVIADSFTGRPSNQSGYNAFASSAIDISPYLTREIALADACVPAPYVVSRGTLTPVPFSDYTSAGSQGVFIPANSLTGQEETIAEVSIKLIADYPQLQHGDTITFVCVGFVNAVDGDNNSGYRGTPIVVSLKLDTANTSALTSSNLQVEPGSLVFSPWGDSDLLASAVVVSRIDGSGTLQTSFAQLQLSSAAGAAYSDFRTDNALYEATESYGVGSDSILRV